MGVVREGFLEEKHLKWALKDKSHAVGGMGVKVEKAFYVKGTASAKAMKQERGHF